MRTLTASAALALCLGFALAAPSMAAQAKKAAPAHRPAAPRSTANPPAKPDPAAVDALIKMSVYLQSLSSFEVTTQTSLDLVADDDQRLQLDGTTRYRVRKPDRFLIEVVSDNWNRTYVYDGAQFTLYAPSQNLFSSWNAPSTIQATLKDASDRFGISLPLEDLFRWAGDDGTRAERLDGGFLVGTATIDGTKTNHYAFREGLIDWQVWIAQGDQPLPLKMVIVDRHDKAGPAYVARLRWTLNPTLADDVFVFRPNADAKRIRVILQK